MILSVTYAKKKKDQNKIKITKNTGGNQTSISFIFA
jgi:hypothetical protein